MLRHSLGSARKKTGETPTSNPWFEHWRAACQPSASAMCAARLNAHHSFAARSEETDAFWTLRPPYLPFLIELTFPWKFKTK